MVCPNCSTLILATDLFCRKCGMPMQRPRAAAIDYGRNPEGMVPVETSRGIIWDPPEPELQRREFLSRRPPPLNPRGGRVKFSDDVQVRHFEKDGSSQKGDYAQYCPYCDCEQPLQRVGQKRCCPGCHRFM